ncbi:MAG: MFS transporter [Opitutales bacterium]
MSNSSDTTSTTKDSAANSGHRKLPVSEKIAYGAGEVTNRYGENGINDVAPQVYNIIFGLNPAAIGIVMMVVRIWDAITDPIMGYISDNWKGKRGRRKPFILLGSVLMAIAYPLVWMASPDWTENAKMIYFLCFSIIFFTCYTIFSVPFRALSAEMTTDYAERTTVRVYGSFFIQAFMLGLPWVFPLAQRDIFPDPVTGIRIMAALSAILIIAAGILCALIPKEKYRKVAAEQETVKLLPSFKSLIKDKVFLIMHGVGLGLLSSVILVGSMGLYVNMFYVWEGDTLRGSEYFAIMQNILQVLSFVMLFVISKYLINFEKKKLIFLALLFAIIGSVSRWFTFHKGIPELIFLDPIFFAPANSLFWVVWLSMAGDFCDYDEHARGQRREGLYGAIGGWVMKAGVSLAIGLSGILLAWTEFDQALGGDQPDGTLTKMRLLLVWLPIICLLIAIVLNAMYPLTKERMATIRKELEERRGVI